MFKSTERSVLLCQQLINFQSGGGSSEVGISDGKGIVNLNIFTQMDEPTKKDGIWIKTNHTFQHIQIDNTSINNSDGTWKTRQAIKPQTNSQFNSAIVYNGEIYAEYSSSIYEYIYKVNLNNNSSTLLYSDEFSNSYYLSFVFNNKLFLSDHKDYSAVMQFDTTQNKMINTNYGSFMRNMMGAIEYNGKLYFQNNYGHDICSYDGSTVTTELSYTGQENTYYTNKNMLTLNGKIYMAYCCYNASTYILCVYDVENNTFSKLCTLPNNNFGSICLYNNEINYIGNNIGNNIHYKYNITSNTFTRLSDTNCYAPLVYNNAIYNVYDFRCVYEASTKVYNPNTVIMIKTDLHNGNYLTNISDTSIISGVNNRFVSGFDDCYYFADTAFDWTAPMYYGDGTKWIKFKN